MDKSNFKWYREQAEKWKQADFNLRPKEEICIAHLLCEAKGISVLGIGGDAHSHWVAGLFKNGVYLYAENYTVKTRYTEDPTTSLIPQCQDAAAYGNPFPKPENGNWVDRDIFPDDVKNYIRGVIRELCQEVYDVIIARAEKIEAQMKQENEIDDEKVKRINNAWALVAK